MHKTLKIIIIGSGASGSAAAWNLSQGLFEIICFEQGPDLKKKTYSTNRNDWEVIKQTKLNPNPNIRRLKHDYLINDKKSPISIANFNAVGGSTLLYNCHFPRFHQSDFKTKTLDNVGEDWPLSYKDLEKYYKINEKLMSVRGLNGDPFYPDINHLKSNIPLGRLGIKLAKGFNKLKWHWWPSYSAYLNDKNLDFQKSTVKENYLKKAKKNGVKINKNCLVTKIVLDSNNLAKGVFYVNSSGESKFENADVVILAAGGIGTPRLLLNSKNKKFPNGLANSSKLVGKNLMLHPLGYVEGIFKKYIASNIGPEGCCLASHQFYETKNDRNFKRGYSMQIIRGAGPLNTILNLRKFRKMKFGKDFHKIFFDFFGKTAGIAIICEDLPDEKNFIELDKSPQSKKKIMPDVSINYSLSNNTKNMMKHGLNNAKKILINSGAKISYGYGPVRNTGWHIMGTTKMGNKPNKSVVNKFGQCHDVKNIFIVDSSIFVTSGGVNCMSTIQALSLYITNNLKLYYNQLVGKNDKP